MSETNPNSESSTRPAAAPEPRELDLLPVMEGTLAQPLLEGMPLGPTLTDAVVIELLNSRAASSVTQRWKDRLRWLRMRIRATVKHGGLREFPPNRVLVTWRNSTPRINELVMPVIEALEPQRCIVIYQNADVLAKLPAGAYATSWQDSVPHDPSKWAVAYRRCWPRWRAGLKRFCRDAAAPRGTYERFSVHLMHASMLLLGCLEFLTRCRPTAIVTEHDRSSLWSCLILAARQLQIPTFGLLHGVLAPLPRAFRYSLADFQLCWGESHRQNFLQAGEDPARLILAGCPRLSREIVPEPTAIRTRLGFDPHRPVVMLGTSPIRQAECLQISEVFCAGMELLGNVTGIVRLHPSEKLETYAETIRRHPSIHFLDNRQITLDEAMAAADVVAVQNSGLGSDALVKRRLAVVIDIPPSPLGHGLELVQEAGCPRVVTPQEFAATVAPMLFDAELRRQRQVAAERYVANFCAFFGRDSARRIAEAVNEVIASGTVSSSRSLP